MLSVPRPQGATVQFNGGRQKEVFQRDALVRFAKGIGIQASRTRGGVIDVNTLAQTEEGFDVSALPEPLLNEVLDFAEFLNALRATRASNAPSVRLHDLCGGKPILATPGNA